jgi:uncharacterized protein YndB with AHSA1/START domain
MSATTQETSQTYELKITRMFDAPRELVWKVWTDSAMKKQWMGPRGFAASEYTFTSKVGEAWHMKMEGFNPRTGGKAMLGQHGRVLEVDPPRLLKFTLAWDDRSCVGLPESPFKENVVTVELEERGRKTLMTFTQGPFATENERDGHNGGWNSSFDKFAEFVLAEQPVRITNPDEIPTELHIKRFFKAPRQLVFDAWTKPEMVAQWWGPKGFSSVVQKWEAKGGGEIMLHMNGHGMSHPMGGRFVEVYPPYRFHFIAAALDANGKPMFENWNSVFFEEVDGGTMVTLDVHVMSQTEVAPQYLKGMTAGWNSSLERLADFVEAK